MLVEALEGEQGQVVLQDVNIEQLIYQGMKIVMWILEKSNIQMQDTQLVREVYQMFYQFFFFRKESLEYYFGFKDADRRQDFRKYMIRGLTFPRSEDLRNSFFHTMYYLCSNF